MLSISPANPVISDDDVRELDRHRRIPEGFFFFGVNSPSSWFSPITQGGESFVAGVVPAFSKGLKNSSSRLSHSRLVEFYLSSITRRPRRPRPRRRPRRTAR